MQFTHNKFIISTNTIFCPYYLTGMTILHPTDEDNINDEGIIHDEVIRNNEESHHH